MIKEMESLGLSFDFNAIGIDGNNEDNNNNSSTYLKNKISLEEVREIPNEVLSVDELEQLFLKSYEDMPDDLLFDGWKTGDDEALEQEDCDPDEGDYAETCDADYDIGYYAQPCQGNT